MHNYPHSSAENLSYRKNPIIFSELMFGKSPKRRRVQPATTQSKLHHFFSKPVKRAEHLLSQSSSQVSTSKINPSKRCKLLEEENQIKSRDFPNKHLISPFEKPKNLLQAFKNPQELRKDSVLRDIRNSKSFVDNKYDGKESSLFSDENLQSRLSTSSGSLATNTKDADNVCSDGARIEQDYFFRTTVPDSIVGQQSSLAHEESLNSNDVNTLPFSAIIGEVISSSECDKKDELKRNNAAGSCLKEEETLEEMNTNDVNTIPSSLVINKISPIRPQRKTESEPTEEPEEEELNTCDVMTLPSSFIVGCGSKLSEDKALIGDTKTSDCNAQIKEGSASSDSKQSSKDTEPNEESGKVHDTLSYMDKVWAMFESDSDEELNTDAITKAGDKEKSGMKEVGDVNLSLLKQESQLEELNTTDVLSAEYSPVIGGGTSKSNQAEPDRRVEVNCSDFSETVGEIDTHTEEDSLTLDNFCGMRGPDSVFS